MLHGEGGNAELLEQAREVIRIKHYSLRTEQDLSALDQAHLFHGKRHPLELGSKEVGAFLSHLAIARRVAASTQNQALSALLFLYRDEKSLSPQESNASGKGAMLQGAIG